MDPFCIVLDPICSDVASATFYPREHAMSLDPSDQAILDRRVRQLVDDALVAEHRADPLGAVSRHSPELIEVLHFLRRNADPSLPRYLVLRQGFPPQWQIGARGPTTSAPVETVDDTRYASREDVEHAVFLRRLADYGLGR
jgi:hypothetical protein